MENNIFEDISKLSKHELKEKIGSLKKELANKIIIPAHHYQSPEIIEFADFIGDSYKLAVESTRIDTEFIIFCGVLFMAEGADLLSKSEQKVLMPEPRAGCPMADMADLEIVSKSFNKISERCKNDIAPVVYINSYADLKSFCGSNNGSVCTSSNAAKILNYYFEQNKSVLFFPDYYLGKNTANLMNIKNDQVVKIKKDLTFEEGNPENAKIFLWDGFCSVHQKFQKSDIDHLKAEYPRIKIIVHPECREEVVNNADISGSTEKISKMIFDSPPGSVWGVGTETTFVHRLASTFTNKTIVPLRESSCYNMEKTTLVHLASSLSSIKEHLNSNGKLLYQVKVNSEYKKNAKKALEKMIEIVEK